MLFTKKWDVGVIAFRDKLDTVRHTKVDRFID